MRHKIRDRSKVIIRELRSQELQEFRRRAPIDPQRERAVGGGKRSRMYERAESIGVPLTNEEIDQLIA
jgi:hypothetical protein